MTTKAQAQTDSKRWDILLIGSILAFIALLMAIIILIIAAVVPNLGALPYLILVKDLALIGAVAVPAYAFITNKGKLLKITYWLCIAVVVVAAIFGNMRII